jgi:hypothetical protein
VHGAAAHIHPAKSLSCHLDAPGQEPVSAVEEGRKARGIFQSSDQVPAGHQSQDRASARPRHAGDVARERRRDDRIEMLFCCSAHGPLMARLGRTLIPQTTSGYGGTADEICSRRVHVCIRPRPGRVIRRTVIRWPRQPLKDRPGGTLRPTAFVLRLMVSSIFVDTCTGYLMPFPSGAAARTLSSYTDRERTGFAR